MHWRRRLVFFQCDFIYRRVIIHLVIFRRFGLCAWIPFVLRV